MLTASIYGQALEAAEADLKRVDEEYRRLGEEKARLETFIATATPLIRGRPSEANGTHPLEPIQADRGQPLWRTIEQAMDGMTEPFGVLAVVKRLDGIGRPVESPNRAQIIRGAMVKKSDVFKYLGDGRFTLAKLATQEEPTVYESTPQMSDPVVSES